MLINLELLKLPKDRPYIKLAYITGILPVKRYNTQSALNNFDEYSMVIPDKLAEYFGFTEDEVKSLYTRFNRDFELAELELLQMFQGLKMILIQYHLLYLYTLRKYM